MATNPLIALSIKQPDVAGSFLKGQQSAMDQQNAAQDSQYRNRLLDLKEQEFATQQEAAGLKNQESRLDINSAQRKIMAQSAADMAMEMDPFVKSGDYQSALRVLDNTHRSLLDQGIKAQDPTALREALQSGNGELVSSINKSVLDRAEKFGVITRVKSDSAPKNVQTAEWYMTATPEQREAYDRANRVGDQGMTEYQRAMIDAQNRRADATRDNKVPAGYRTSQTDPNQLEYVPGGPADPAVNQKQAMASEDERKAAGWFNQANKAFADMTDAMALEKGAASPGLIESTPLLPQAFKNWSKSDARQKYSQAASAFSEAALRAATGAGINNEEAAQKIAELTPQLGDSDALIQQKNASLKMYLDSLQQRAGRALPAGTVNNADAGANARTVVRTGTSNGRRVNQYSDGSIEYAD